MKSKYRYRLFVMFLGFSLIFIVFNSMEIRTWATKKVQRISNLVTKTSSKHEDTGSGVNRTLERSGVLTFKTIVIIVAYMRTGSSLTGSALQEYPGTFYLFEPIRSIYERFHDAVAIDSVELRYPNGTIRYHSTQDHDDVQLAEIKNWVTCNLGDQSLVSLTDSFHKRYAKFMRKLQACALNKLQSYHASPYKYRYSKTFFGAHFWEQCLQRTIGSCREAPLIVLKFIRLSMTVIKKLMPILPNLKVIHLNRDPRGIFNSRSHLKGTKAKSTPEDVHDHCRRWADDLKVVSDLSNTYAGRFMTIQYEQIAESPDTMFQTICDFIDIPYSKEIKQYVHSMTAARKDGCDFCQQRKNSTKTASKWRQEMQFKQAMFIYETCHASNKFMQYFPFDNANDMRNLSLPYHL